MSTRLVLLSALLGATLPAVAQIASWDFDGYIGPANGTAGDSENPFAADSTAGFITSAELNIGAGTIFGPDSLPGGMRHRGWNQPTIADAIANDDYYAFVLDGSSFDVTGLQLRYAPTANLDASKTLIFDLRTSLDGFATSLDSFTDDTSTTASFQVVTLDAGTSVQGVSNVELRLYIANTAASDTSPHIFIGDTGNDGDGLADFAVIGVPEPSWFAPVAAVAALLAVYLRRRR